MKYPKIKEETSLAALLQTNAIEAELKELQQPGNEDRLKAVQLVLLNRTHTIEGAAIELNYSWRTIQIWVSEFINNVAHRAGY